MARGIRQVGFGCRPRGRRPGRLPDPRRQEPQHARRRADRPRRRRGRASRRGAGRRLKLPLGVRARPARAGWPEARGGARRWARRDARLDRDQRQPDQRARAHWVLPCAAWVEREGTFTNFEGRVQRFRAASSRSARRGRTGTSWAASSTRSAGPHRDPRRALVPRARQLGAGLRRADLPGPRRRGRHGRRLAAPRPRGRPRGPRGPSRRDGDATSASRSGAWPS